MLDMKRRSFITLLGGAAAVWPLAARAQQPERVRRIGIVTSVLETDADAQARYAVLRQALQQLGWTEGRNIQFDHRFGSAGDSDVVRKHAQESSTRWICAGQDDRLGFVLPIGRQTPPVVALMSCASVALSRAHSPTRFPSPSSPAPTR